jgi:hypothetical protein
LQLMVSGKVEAGDFFMNAKLFWRNYEKYTNVKVHSQVLC